MTIHLNHFNWTRVALPLYVDHEKLRTPEGGLEPLMVIPDDEVRTTVHIDVVASRYNPKHQELIDAARKLQALVEEVEKLEKDGGFPVGPGGPTVPGLVVTDEFPYEIVSQDEFMQSVQTAQSPKA